MSDFDLVLAGRVVLCERELEQGFVAVRDGRVVLLGEGAAPAAAERHDLGRAMILPGAVDAQVHSLSQRGAEGFAASTAAAAAGGVTTIVDMPYDEGNLVCSARAVRIKAAEAEAEARVDVALYGTIDPSEGPARIAEQADAGVCGFKFSTFGTDPQRFPRIPPALLMACFAEVAKTGLAAGVHNEDDAFVREAIAAVEAAGITDWRAHGLSRPPMTEILAALQIYETGAATGCPAHVVHCSLGRGYEIAQRYRAEGHHATVECCIHYLTLDEENDVARLGGKAKINPPIRRRAEVERLWAPCGCGQCLDGLDRPRQLVRGPQDQSRDAEECLRCAGARGDAAAVRQGGTGARAASELGGASAGGKPARHFRIDDAKGGIAPGRDADLTVLEPVAKVYDARASQVSVAGWSPYDGIELPWTVAGTWLRGTQVFDGAKVLAAPGQGRFVRPLRPLGLRRAVH